MIVALLLALAGLLAVLVIISIIRYCYNKSLIKVKSVKAGPDESHRSPCTEDYHIGPFDTFYHNGRKVDPKKYVVARVDGDCMAARGVYSSNLVFIEPITDYGRKNLEKGDILYIKYEKDGFSGYKIREFHGLDDDDTVNTVYYTAENRPKESYHKLANVEGVVKYNFKS